MKSPQQYTSLSDFPQAIVPAFARAIVRRAVCRWVQEKHASFSFFSLLRGFISNNCSLTPISGARRPHGVFLKRVVSSIRWLVGSLALFMVLAGPAQARRYDLIKGKGVEVCEAYGNNLNSLANTHVPSVPSGAPYQATRPINPEFTDFSKPSIADNDVSPEDTEHFFEEMNRFLWERDINPVYYIPVTDWSKWRGTPEQRNQAWKSFSEYRERWHFLDIVKVDIDNDGVVDQVAMNTRAGIGGILLVLNTKNDGLDVEKTKLVMQHPSRKEQGLGEFRKLFPGERLTLLREKYGYTPVEDLLHGGSYDVFIYKGKTYFDLWWTHHPDYKGKLDILVGGPLRVFMIENKRTREVCTYHYQHTYQLTE